MEQVEKIKAEILKILEVTCNINNISPYEIKNKVDIIEKLSASYNNLCQAQRNQAMPTVELNESGITYGYAMPTVDRFNNIKDNGI